MNTFPASRLRNIRKSLIRQVFDRALPGSINLGLGEPDLPTPDIIRNEAARVAIGEQNGYTTHAGLVQLRELIARDNSALGLEPEDVIVTAGSQEALYLALMSMVDHGDEVLVPDPGFVAYPAITQMAGGVLKTYKMPAAGRFAFDVENFRKALTPRTKVVVCISPSNPTGRALTRGELGQMAMALDGTGAVVISDEIYRDLYFGEVRPPSISEFYARTLVISGLSKSMSMTGWRLGWLCGFREIIKSALVLHGYVTTCASAISQKASLVSWTDAGEQARRRHREIFRGRMQFLSRRIQDELGLGFVTPEGAFYMMVDTSEYGGSLDVTEALLAEGVITVPGVAFGEEGEGFLRLSFCADEDKLGEGVRRIGLALNKMERRSTL
jgi:aspartate/methionine/tyrosine aminotransferase